MAGISGAWRSQSTLTLGIFAKVTDQVSSREKGGGNVAEIFQICLVNSALGCWIYEFDEERRLRRIARAIVRLRRAVSLSAARQCIRRGFLRQPNTRIELYK